MHKLNEYVVCIRHRPNRKVRNIHKDAHTLVSMVCLVQRDTSAHRRTVHIHTIHNNRKSNTSISWKKKNSTHNLFFYVRFLRTIFFVRLPGTQTKLQKTSEKKNKFQKEKSCIFFSFGLSLCARIKVSGFRKSHRPCVVVSRFRKYISINFDDEFSYKSIQPNRRIECNMYLLTFSRSMPPFYCLLTFSFSLSGSLALPLLLALSLTLWHTHYQNALLNGWIWMEMELKRKKNFTSKENGDE